MGLSRTTRRRGVLWTAAALLQVPLLLTGCSGTGGGSSAHPGGGGTAAEGSPASPSSPAASGSSARERPSSAPSSAAPGRGDSKRCRTSELAASLGMAGAGAGQRNFSVALTNQSRRSCTLRGYPGVAFRDASGAPLGPDPRRVDGVPVTRITLAPGKTAWAGLSFPHAELTGADTAVPATLLITPPDEREALSVQWQGGEVPVSPGAGASITALGELD